MKASINKLAQISSERLNSQNVSSMAKTIWLELQSNKKFNKLDELLDKIREQIAKKSHLKIAEIICSKSLSEQEKDVIVNKIERKYGFRIMPVYQTDKTILGGIKVKIEDEVIDLSWRGQLQLIRTRLEAGK